MRIPFSCPFADFDDLDRRFEAFLVRSMSFDSSDVRTALRSISFNGQDSERAMMRSFGSGTRIFERSHNFKGQELETMISVRAPSNMERSMFLRTSSTMSREIGEKLPIDSVSEKTPKMLSLESGNQRFHAALRLQKVYKSFRTRRQLADCAVLVEQKWFVLLFMPFSLTDFNITLG